MILELKQLGFGYYESKIIEVLTREKLTLRELNKKSGVPFGKIYSIVKRLKEMRVVNETNSRPKLIYIENLSEIISNLIKEKQNKELILFKKLREFATNIDKNKEKKTKFFDIGITVEDNKRIQLRTFEEADEEVFQILNIHHKPNSNRESKSIWEDAIADAIKKGVVFKSIYPTRLVLPKKIQELIKKYPHQFQVKRFDTDFVRCDIIDNKKVLIKLVRQDPLLFGGVLFIEDEKLASNLKRIFNEMWEN